MERCDASRIPQEECFTCGSAGLSAVRALSQGSVFVAVSKFPSYVFLAQNLTSKGVARWIAAKPPVLMIFLKGWSVACLLFSFSLFCYLFHQTVYIFHPLQMYFLFYLRHFLSLSYAVYTCLFLKALPLFLIYYLAWGCCWERSLSIGSFACASEAIKKASLVTPNSVFIAPCSRSCSAAAGIECVWEGFDLLTPVFGAPGMHRVTSLVKTEPWQRAAGEVTPLVGQQCSTWSFISGFEMWLRCL